jgi:hypothetical protein
VAHVASVVALSQTEPAAPQMVALQVQEAALASASSRHVWLESQLDVCTQAAHPPSGSSQVCTPASEHSVAPTLQALTHEEASAASGEAESIAASVTVASASPPLVPLSESVESTPLSIPRTPPSACISVDVSAPPSSGEYVRLSMPRIPLHPIAAPEPTINMPVRKRITSSLRAKALRGAA